MVNKNTDDLKSAFAIRRDYKEWMRIKANIHNGGKFRTFSEGQVWWCVLGENVGIEINGKGSYFLRPIFVLKKNGRLGFIGIPLTTKAHSGYGYLSFDFKGKTTYAVFSQIKTISVFRLLRKMGEVDDLDFEKIQKGIGEFLGFL